MKPTETLKEEHVAIQSMLSILVNVCEKLESGAQINPEHLEQMIDFIKGFADKCHHGKEEDLLFPAMEEAGIPREGGPIGIMLIEHDEGRIAVKGMSDATDKYKAGDKFASSEFIQNARAYIDLLTQHIEKENNILFAMADMHLSEEKQEALTKEFEVVEQEKIGAGRHEELRGILDRLKSIYL